MTSEKFRELALALPETAEAAHMGHPDFRVAGKIFATLWADGESGMVKLTPTQQALVVTADPTMFEPVKGGWGARGATRVRLPAAKAGPVRKALALAWLNTAPKRLARAADVE
jgi:hypothetical protein